MKKINVSQERCIGCGACVAIDPEHFEFNDDGKSAPITNENLESENLVNAIESCPTSAIEMKEETENNEEQTNNTIEQDNEVCDCDNCDCDNCENSDDEECECDDCCECPHHQEEQN